MITTNGGKQAHFANGQLYLMDHNINGFMWLPLGNSVVFSRIDEITDLDKMLDTDVQDSRQRTVEVVADGSQDDEPPPLRAPSEGRPRSAQGRGKPCEERVIVPRCTRVPQALQ